MRKSLSLIVLPLSCLALVAGACSSSKPPVAQAPVVDAGSDAGSFDSSDASVGMAGPSPAMDASAPPFFTGDTGGAIAAVGDQALDAVIDVAITTVSAKAAPKMEKEGQAGRATLNEGEHWGMVVTLQPNRCYTFIGNSPPGAVTQLDLKLQAMPLMIDAGKSTKADKNTPVIGKGTAPLCPILPIAVPYKLDVAATKGAGRMGVQVFSRNK